MTMQTNEVSADTMNQKSSGRVGSESRVAGHLGIKAFQDLCFVVLGLSLLLTIVLTGCGGGYPGIGLSSLSASASTIDAGQSVALTAGVAGNLPVSWSLMGTGCTGLGCGVVTGGSGNTATYLSPAYLAAPIQVTLQATISGTNNQRVVTITVNPDPVIGGILPSAAVGETYSATLTTSGGTGKVTLSIASGSLPPGLTFNAATGVISGSPMTAGTYNFVAQATDSADMPVTVRAAESITIVAAGSSLAIIGGNPPAGVVGTPYTTGLIAAGGTKPYTWSIVGGALPAGLTLSASTGVISGTPTTQGTFPFTAQVQDATGAKAVASFSITITTGSQGTTLTITTGTLPNGTVGVPYSATIGVTGGTGPYTCTIVTGALPAGLSLGGACVVSGTPTVAGTANLTVKATDSSNPTQTATGPVSITIVPAPLSIGMGGLPGGTVGIAYSATIPVNGGTAPYSCVITAGTLPAGLSLGANCLVSGTPTVAGTANLTVKATDSSNPVLTATGTVSITIAPGALIVGSGNLPSGPVGIAYSAPVPVSGGTPPYNCVLTNGTLPAGLTLGANCVVSGTPTVPGTTTVTVKVTDAGTPVQTASGPVSITITASPVLTITGPPAGTQGSPYDGTVAVSGGTGPYTCTLQSGTLQTGLTLNPNCHITGTPSTSGTTSISVKATDGSSPANTTTSSVNVTINPASATLTLTSPPNGTVGTPYTGGVGVTGGMAPYTCTLNAGALPAGLTLNANCSITGTPTTAGPSTFTVKATDSGAPAATTTGSVTLTIAPMPPLTLTGSLPNGIVGVPYTQTLKAAGGMAPYTYAVTAGALPAGLTLSATGVISGTPTAPGAASFTVTATDSEATPMTASLPLVLLIAYPASANTGLLKGPYAFLFQGYDDVVAGVLAYRTATVGSFTADGAGLLTSGELDSNHQGSVGAATTVPTSTLIGTYTIGADDRGQLTITALNADGTTGRTTTYAIAVKPAVAPATTSARGSLIEFDNNSLVGTRGSGTFLAQTPAAFTTGLAGGYAFGMSGDTPCLPACTAGLIAGPVASVGRFTASAGALSAGNGDSNIASTNFANSTLTGSYGGADGNGRAQLALATSAVPAAYFPTDYAVYVVNATQAFVMSTDKHSAYILLAGSMTQQAAAGFTAASVTGPYVGYENSPTNPGLAGTTLQNVLNLSTATTFRGTADGAGTCTTTNVDVGGTTGLVNGVTGLGSGAPIINALLGTYQSLGNSACTVAANGRTVLNYPVPNSALNTTLTLLGLATTPPPARIVYLTGTNSGYFLESGYAGLGMLEQQIGSPFTVATLNGTFVYGTAPAASLASTNGSGVFTADGAGHAASTLDLNVGVGNINVLQLGTAGTYNYTLTDPAAGRYVLGTTIVVYAIAPGRFVLLDTSPLVTSPSVALLY